MACFDVNGHSVGCGNELCVGPDCHSSFNPTGAPDQEVFIPSLGNEGMWNMSQDEFMDWFEDLHDWGSSLEGMVLPGQEAPVLIPWHEAEQVAEMFSGYNQSEELYILGQLAQEVEFSNNMFRDWEHSANVQMYGKQERDREMTGQAVELAETQSKYKEKAGASRQKMELLKGAHEKRSIASAEASGKKVTREKEMSENKISSMVNDYLINRSLEDNLLHSRVHTLLEDNTNKEIESRAQLDKLIHQKDFSRQKTMRQDYEAKRDYIANLRDQYEADIWNVIGEFGLSQRFLQSGQV